MRKWLPLLFLFLFSPALCFSQGVRLDGIAIRGTNPLQSIGNAQVTICTSAGTGNPCTPLATTYTSATLATPCPGGAQLVLAGTSTCVAVADNSGNYGAWVAPGKYILTITAVGIPGYSTTITAACEPTSACAFAGAVTATGTPPFTATNAGVFTNTQMNEYVTSSLNSCNPATQYNNSFDYNSFATDGVSGCIITPNGATAFESHSVAGYAENQGQAAGTGAIGVYGKCSNTVSVNGRCWGGAFYASDHNVATNALYSVELDNNINNASTQGTGLLITGFWKAQPTASRAINIAQPQQGVGCVTCSWPSGIIFGTAATQAPDFVNANTGAMILPPLSALANSNSQGIVLWANKAVSGTTVGGFQMLANGQLNLVGGNGLNQGAISTSTASSIVPASPTSVGLTGDAGAGASGANYGVIGAARAPTGVTNAYGGWFKATAQTLATAEVGVHAEVTDTTGTAIEAIAAGVTPFKCTGAGCVIGGGINTSAPASGSTGFQHKRVAGCATAASLNATCDTTVTWTSAFADANYTPVCTGEGVTSGVPIVEGHSISAAKTGAAITVRTISITAAAAQFTTLDCTAVHD